MRTFALLLCVFGAAGALSAQTPAPVELSPEQTKAILECSLVSAGDASRLKQVFAKAERGEKLVVGVIGGSITQGAKATTAEKRYPNVVAQWWRKNFPKSEVTLVNAGIGATGSNYGALRAQRDLLSKAPDFVIVEYACNDGNGKPAAVTLEGLVRQILKAPRAPAVMLLFMTRKDGTNTQEWHSKVGAHYHLPMVSFRDGIWPGCKSGELKIEDFLADEVHPNDFGHGITAACVAHLLEEARKTDVSGSKTDPPPAPLFSAEYESTTLLEAADLKPVANQGWIFQDGPKGKWWHAEEPGSVIEFEIKGSTILFMSHVIRGAMGRAEVRADDLPPKTIDGWFSGTWGGYRMTTAIGEGLDAKATHRVRVKLLEEKSPESTGHGFSIFGLGAAGTQ